MTKKQAITLVLPVLVVGLLSFTAGNWVSASSEKNDSSGESLADRIGKLEDQVAALQRQVEELASKSTTRVLTVPGTTSFPGKNIPPGATEHEINGMKYWLIPLKNSK